MRLLIIDVAAEYGGAASVLEQFVNRFYEDSQNEYIVILSKIYYKDRNNVTFVNVEWVKKSYFHRLYFDNIYIKDLVRRYKPDHIISLQNKSVRAGKISQTVFYHNALPIAERKYSLIEDPKLWLYQNIIGRVYRISLKNVSTVIVQADWIRDALVNEWHIPLNKIKVEKPVVDQIFSDENSDTIVRKTGICKSLFYPAGYAKYKNHEVLFKALCLCSTRGIRPKLILTLIESDIKQRQLRYNLDAEYPVEYVGTLSKKQMKDIYLESVLVFPSYIETIGLPLIEAKSLGCRILAADCKYAHDLLDEYDLVRFFNPDEPESLAQAIIDEFYTLYNT